MDEEAEVVFVAPADAVQEDDNDEEYDGRDEDLSSPLIAAALVGDLMTARSLLQGGRNKNKATNFGRTAMWYAARNGHLEIVRLLVEHGADTEKGGNIEDGTPLWIASSEGHLAIVRYLWEQGADKNAIGQSGDTILGTASLNGHLPVVTYLVEQGADMEEVDNGGHTSLHNASMRGHVDVARHLLEQGADRDKAENCGYTSLHYAAQNYHLDITKLLMVYGADLNARTNAGQLPIDITHDEEVKQAIRDEPRRRMDEAPGKRATEQDRHPNAATSASAQHGEYEEEQVVEHASKRQRLDEGGEEGKVAEEDEDSEPSDGEDDD